MARYFAYLEHLTVSARIRVKASGAWVAVRARFAAVVGDRHRTRLPRRRAALVVATGTYADPELSRLVATARDAELMAGVLRDPGVGAFEVTAVIDGGEREIRERVEGFLAGRRRRDMVVVYLSCHGVLDARDRLYFAAADTVQSRLASTGVEAAWLLDRLDECPAVSQVVILDCCFSGAFARGTAKGAGTDVRVGQRLAAGGRGRAVLTASKATERSWVGDTDGAVSGLSVFTRFLAEGLRTGAADTDGDGLISVDDAYSYAYEEVMASGAGQTPQRYISGGEGALWLARNPVGPGQPRGRGKARTALALGVSVAAALVAVILIAQPGTTNKTSVYSARGYGFSLPDAIAADGAHVWVANEGGPSVTELNTADGSLVRTLSAPSYGFFQPTAIAVDGAHVWVVNGNGGDSVTELNAGDGSWVQTLHGSSYGFNYPDAIAVDGAHVWVVNNGGESVTELNAADGSLVQVLSAASYHFTRPDAIAADGPHVWVANSYGGSVTELNAADGSLVRIVSAASWVYNSPDGIAVDGSDVWVVNRDGNSVTELNAADGGVVRILSAASYGFDSPDGIVADGTQLWVANGDSVTELNAADGRLVRTLSGRSYGFDVPAGIAVDGSQLWTANEDGNSVTELSA
jgi:hypothetical protein